ncbi:MAG: hypothetical protein JHC33_14635 [Ignisphaera sp.]|nr:hypothetical protein [Ignisphaera sp.]
MQISIESKEEFQRLSKKIVNEYMVRIKIEDEELVSKLMYICFEAGYELSQNGKVGVDL